jgi:hypothetical protein
MGTTSHASPDFDPAKLFYFSAFPAPLLLD